jgi:hypothetical protein
MCKDIWRFPHPACKLDVWRIRRKGLTFSEAAQVAPVQMEVGRNRAETRRINKQKNSPRKGVF